MMLDTFITSFKLKNAYKVNGIIYSLKSIPLIKKLLPTSLYASTGLKKFANAVSLLYEVNTFFFGKALYLLLMVFLPGMQMPGTISACFIHIFFFLTISGGFLNTQIFHPTKDKYYALILLRMNAKKYMLSNYIYYLSKILIGFLPFTLLFGLLSGVNVFLCLLMPVYVAAVKLIISAVALLDFKKSGRIKNDSIPSPTVWIYTAVSFTAAYAAPD